jgi:hypothetical protein
MTMRSFGICVLTIVLALTGCSRAQQPADEVTDAPDVQASPTPEAPADLLADVTWEYRLNDGEWQADELIVPANFQGAISARAIFTVTAEQLDEMACVQIEQLTNDRIRMMDVNYLLNGQMVVPPLMERGVFLDTIYGVSKDLLQVGDNELAFTINAGNGPEPMPFWDVRMHLLAMRPEHLALRTGPIVSAFDDESVWITCRTNLPASVTLTGRWTDTDTDVEFTSQSSADGLVHQLQVARGGNTLEYMLTIHANDSDYGMFIANGTETVPIGVMSSDASTTLSLVPFTVHLWSEGEPLRFVFTGDTQRNPDAWGAIANAVAAEQVTLAASIGDMNEDGLFEWRWDPELFTPGAAMFATTPFYPGVGNHEVNYNSHYGNRDAFCAILDDFFVMPANHMRHSWAQQIGPVLIISIEGHRDFSPGTELYAWLSDTLDGAGEDVQYIFLLDHYPAWSSSGYTELGADGSEPRWYVDALQMREVIVPLLQQHNATALVCGHDHFYQRSETPDGFTQVLTGTAGSASTEGAVIPAGTNPYAVIGRGGPHYCLFEVTDEGCVMTVKTADGEVIDTRTWAPRAMPAD